MGMGKLTDTWLKRAKVPNGIYGDGDRLYLRVQGTARSWLFIYSSPVTKKRREMGLGGYPAVSLVNARRAAQAARDFLASGKLIATGGIGETGGIDSDPIERKVAAVREVKAAARTLSAVCEEFIVAKSGEWSDGVAERYRGYIANQLNGAPVKRPGPKRRSRKASVPARRPSGENVKVLFPSGRGSKRIDSVTVADIEALLKPVWHTPTGPYLRSFLERVFDFAMVKGYVPQGLNIARLRGHLEHVLPRVRRVTEHHAAMPWADVPALMERLRCLNTSAAAALRFTILTASRQLEVREMRWREVDLATGVWVIPAERYKTRREHIVPLSREALSLLGPGGAPDAFVFPGYKAGRPISQHIFGSLLEGGYKPHGFRTSFAVWCVEQGGFTDELAQRCLGHVIGTETTRAYQRSDFMAAKRACLAAWAAFVSSGKMQRKEQAEPARDPTGRDVQDELSRS